MHKTQTRQIIKFKIVLQIDKSKKLFSAIGREHDAALNKDDSYLDPNNEILKKSRFINPLVATPHWQIVTKKPNKKISVRRSKDVNYFKCFLPGYIKSQCRISLNISSASWAYIL
jgi:hypothetical protein